jgi:hypothetical protein
MLQETNYASFNQPRKKLVNHRGLIGLSRVCGDIIPPGSNSLPAIARNRVWYVYYEIVG